MILVYIEEREGKIKKSSLEALSEGKRKADETGLELNAVLVGHNMETLAEEVLSYTPSKVYVLENTLLKEYSASGFVHALYSLVKELTPKIIMFSATAMGKDLAPRLSAKLGVSMASDCIGMDVKNGTVEALRPIFAGKALETISFQSTPQILSLRPNIFPLISQEGKKGEVVKQEVEISEEDIKSRVEEVVREGGEELDISEAQVIVSGGRGMKNAENFELLKELTAIVPNSAVGASRSAVDSGWIDHQNQVGQTGKTVSPDLYMAFGISGAIQHLAGMSSSKYIIAVNKDPEAPIFNIADFGIVGDLFEVIPPLKEELKKILSD